MEINTNDFVEQCMKAIQNKLKNLNMLNLIVLGKTGVGKSTLINSIFREELADTGIGKPVTSKIKKITKKDVPISIYDVPGFELEKGQAKEVINGILSLIKKGNDSRDINQMIHCILYCINACANRIEDIELEWIKQFTVNNSTTKVPVIVVLTQAAFKNDARTLKNIIEKENLNIKKVIPVLAQDKVDEDTIFKSYGLDNLVGVMSEVLPDELQDSFLNVQKVSLNEKKKKAHAAVATAAAVAAGASPIPFSDAALLIPDQIAMISSITVIFGMEFNKSLLTSLVSSTIGTVGSTILGKTAVSNIFKLIPGIGTIAGSFISGSTAGVITTALGEAYIGIMEMMFKGDIASEDLQSEAGKELMSNLFKMKLKESKNNPK